MLPSLLVIGRGRAAQTLAPAWERAGYPVTTYSRADGPIPAAPPADVVILAVTDRALAEVARALATRASASRELWLHLSGATPAAVLRQTATVPAAVGCLHPLVALTPGHPLTGAVAGVEGEPHSLSISHALGHAVGLETTPIPSDRALYHAAAVSVAGHATALFSQAISMLTAIGFSPELARRALAPLLASAAHNLAAAPPPDALTGPTARGDASTIAAHLHALIATFAPDDARVATYRLLSQTALELVLDRLAPEAIQAIRDALADPRIEDDLA